jgi:uncharacterized protein YbaP (TraB family)
LENGKKLNPLPFLGVCTLIPNFIQRQRHLYSTMHLSRFVQLSVIFLLSAFTSGAQQKKDAKYPSLLWQITGNGLTRPSYLFGTMHVSSKLAFHLRDSFYYALKNVDAVALELNPETWQPQMVRLNDLNQNYTNYTQIPGTDFLTENSFRITKYDDLLKSALSTEPPVVNSLLYRSYQMKEDFEEDTFLDLYIFQTGRKLGKAPAGVEDYYESEKLVLEAYADMAKEKKKKEVDLDGETMGSLVEKMQNAYRRGDLDLMDSLDNMMESSVAFREKFLYKRNDIQAASIDSIIRTRSLFAGVGAAHLAGERGVIEQLRKMGYTLRPIKMADRDANQKDNIDKLKVKVNFKTQYSPDGMYCVDVPGQLYVLRNAYVPLDRSQFADMNNGSYYLVTRVKTYASFTGQTEAEVQKKIDSLLYENIPGKILAKTVIQKNGYKGYDISNRTRRGDLQRYQIFITPFEIILFKMSGKNDYVAGEEATRFFNSIQLKPLENKPVNFTPVQKGFSINLPQPAHQYYDGIGEDRWEYEAADTTNGDAYLVLKKNVYNYNFIEEDSFDLSLVEESFRSPDYFDKQISRKQTTWNGYPGLFVREKLKNGQFVNAAYILKGPAFYVFAKRTANENDTAFAFINSLKWENYAYTRSTAFVDSFFHFKINTPVRPQLDEGIRSLIEKTTQDAYNGNNASGYITYWLKERHGILQSDSTGEMVSISVQEYPKYFYISDSGRFWKNAINEYVGKNDMLVRNKSALNLPAGSQGWFFALQDTGSSRMIERMLLLKDKYLYSIATVSDTISGRSDFVNSVFGSFVPYNTDTLFEPYEKKLGLFFDDLFSTDSALHKKAQQAITNVYYGKQGAPYIYDAITRLSINDKDYFDTKAKLISELGYIKDSVTNDIPDQLKKLYAQTADTALFQNEVIKSLARLKTSHAYAVLKEIMLQDPPIFNEEDDYRSVFNNLEDSLALSASLFPDLLKLSTLTDYKEPVTELLVMLVDSGFIKGKNYKDYFSSIYIDAKVAQKKQKAADEQKMQDEKKKQEENDQDDVTREYNRGNNLYGLNDYAVLLMPFYDKDINVQQYFTRLLQSKDDYVKMNAAILMLRNKKDVPDAVFNSIVNKEKLIGTLYTMLEDIKRLDKFPAAYKNQLALARSYMLSQNNFDKMDSVVMLDKKTASLKGKTGQVYFFKYRIKRSDDWKIGMSGLQPLIETELSSNDDLSVLTDKKFKEYEPAEEQFNLQLKRILFGYHRSARNFFVNENGYNFKSLGYED